MQVTELLEKIRGHYIQRLLEAIADARTEEGVTIVHEPALRDKQGEIARSGPLDIPMRVDIAKVRDGEVIDSINVDTKDMVSFSDVVLRWPAHDLQVTIEPFPWNWLQIQTAASPSPDDWHVIRNWYLKWFREEDPAPDQLAGSVHFLDDPRINGSLIELTIDLGSAPVDCVAELLDALGEFGAREVQVGQFVTQEK